MSCSPWPPPLLTLTKTSRGQTLGGNMDGFNVGSNMTAKQENVGKYFIAANFLFFKTNSHKWLKMARY